MQCLSEGLCLLLPSVKPHKARTSFATAANLHKDQVPSLSRPPQLIPLPGDDRIVSVCRTDYLQGTNGFVGDRATEYEDVEADDIQPRAHLLC